jgi:hypothetical protein
MDLPLNAITDRNMNLNLQNVDLLELLALTMVLMAMGNTSEGGLTAAVTPAALLLMSRGITIIIITSSSSSSSSPVSPINASEVAAPAAQQVLMMMAEVQLADTPGGMLQVSIARVLLRSFPNCLARLCWDQRPTGVLAAAAGQLLAAAVEGSSGKAAVTAVAAGNGTTTAPQPLCWRHTDSSHKRPVPASARHSHSKRHPHSYNL